MPRSCCWAAGAPTAGATCWGRRPSSSSFVIGLLCTFQLAGLDEKSVGVDLFTFISGGSLDVRAGLLFDPLSAMFVLLITGVGSLIHIYSIGYMAHDPGRRRFFAYLNLFIAAMLLLVLGNSYVALYVGWEGVGLASYLLIAFWYTRPAAATAAKKAFIMNRVGDVGLALAIFLMFSQLGTTSYEGVFGGVGTLAGGTVTAMGLLLLLGACGKSGQFPLQAWLPDAMEGPTPVSALIHAATMVTAGVYLIARSAPIYDLTETARTVVMCIGALTLLIGAIAGCAYDDIKKVLAYSTVSQIGYMFLAVGLGPVGYVAGLAHLLAHGFFKAGLFLGAGSVMHAMNDGVDMRRFGGLWKKLPITFATFGLGYLALIGFPFLSGYWTKDAIIEATFDRGDTLGYALGGIAVLAAGLTAFYMTRLMLMTFFGRARWEDGVHPHESPPVMTVPMIVLAVGSVGRRLPAGAGLPAVGLAGAGLRRAGGGRARRSRRSPSASRCSRVMVIGALARLAVRRPPRGAGDRAGAGLVRDAGRPQRALRRPGQRVAVHAPRPVADPRAGLLRQPRASTAPSTAWPPRSAVPRRGWAGPRPASCAPTPSGCSAAPCWSRAHCWR